MSYINRSLVVKYRFHYYTSALRRLYYHQQKASLLWIRRVISTPATGIQMNEVSIAPQSEKTGANRARTQRGVYSVVVDP